MVKNQVVRCKRCKQIYNFFVKNLQVITFVNYSRISILTGITGTAVNTYLSS